MPGTLPLSGIVIVEIGHSVAAPYAGLILADLGARVIKVENPKSGDYARGWGPPFWNGIASTFLCLNRGKEGYHGRSSPMPGTLGSAEDRLILEQADAVIQNLRPGILEKFGLTGAALRAELSPP